MAESSHPSSTLQAPFGSSDAVRQSITKMISKVDSGAPLSGEERAEILETLEQHECWNPYFRLIKRQLDDAKTRQLGDYVRLARVQNLYLEDVFAAAETCANMTTAMSVSYEKFNEQILPQVIEFEDFAAEATILGAICDRLPSALDHVACLERLCMLYEKKTHNESQLGNTYEKLLQADPRNVKALRYFKLVFIQNNEWEEVVGVLRTLLECVTHPQELFRVAQELAAIYLYQLDMAEDAITILDTYCESSPLDTSNILFDAYQRLADWQGCLKVLRECLLNVDDDHGRAVLHYKIATLLDQIREPNAALENYIKAAKLWPQFLDAIEAIINITIAKKDWAGLQHWLEVLTERVHDEKLAAQLRQATRRLAEGISHAQQP
jgi:tetratricopeptide (TPR) repeat protein